MDEYTVDYAIYFGLDVPATTALRGQTMVVAGNKAEASELAKVWVSNNDPRFGAFASEIYITNVRTTRDVINSYQVSSERAEIVDFLYKRAMVMELQVGAINASWLYEVAKEIESGEFQSKS